MLVPATKTSMRAVSTGTFTVIGLTSEITTNSWALVSPSTLTGTAAISRGGVVWAQRIPIQWESTDTIVLSWLAAQNSKNIPGNDKRTKYGSGQIAGAALGAILGLAIVVVGVWMYLRRKKRKKTDTGKHVRSIRSLPELRNGLRVGC